jgi:hypothetical protein
MVEADAMNEYEGAKGGHDGLQVGADDEAAILPRVRAG